MEQVDNRVVARSGFLLGFAVGGFLDGILLHQILQWHHLLSALERAPFGDPRVQILADGVFHAAMYLIAVIGVYRLWRIRHGLNDRSANRSLGAGVLLGFSGWHMADAVLSHWLLGIHHIRMGVPDPVFWDLLWLGIFGLVPAAIGFALLRRPPSRGDHDRRNQSQSTLVSLLVVTVIAGALASLSLPAGQNGKTITTVLLLPNATPTQLMAGATETDARVIWSSTQGDVWVLALDRTANPLAFYRHGALFVSGTLMPAGCASWFRLGS
jgi:uncharacterized membrane protein